MLLVHIVGFLAAVPAFVMFLPALQAVWRNRHDSHALRSASIGMNVVLACNAILWFAYAALSEAFWVGAPGFVNLPLAITSIVLIVKACRRDHLERSDESNLSTQRIFITAPAGYGSVVTASDENRHLGITFRTNEELQRIRETHQPSRTTQ